MLSPEWDDETGLLFLWHLLSYKTTLVVSAVLSLNFWEDVTILVMAGNIRNDQ